MSYWSCWLVAEHGKSNNTMKKMHKVIFSSVLILRPELQSFLVEELTAKV